MFVDPVADAESVDGVVGVGIEAVGVEAGEKLVDGQTRNQGVQLDHGRPVFLDALDVSVMKLSPVCGWVRPEQPGRANLFHGVDVAAQQTRTAGLEVVHCAANLVDAAVAVGLEFDAKIEVRQEVEGGQLVEQMTTVD